MLFLCRRAGVDRTLESNAEQLWNLILRKSS